jgi:hypothetical protein
MAQAQARAADLSATVSVMQRRLRASAYTPQGPNALALFRSYDKHGAGGLSLPEFRAVVRKGAKTSEEDLDDHELVKLWKLLLATNGGTVAPPPPPPPPAAAAAAAADVSPAGRGHHSRSRRPMLSSNTFVSFVHGEQELDLLQCCAAAAVATPVRPNTAAVPPSSGSSERRRRRSPGPTTSRMHAAGDTGAASPARQEEPSSSGPRPDLDGTHLQSCLSLSLSLSSLMAESWTSDLALD